MRHGFLVGLALLALLACAWPPARGQQPPKEPARLALLIGNEKYTADVGPLKNPVNDIHLLKSRLDGLGFKVATVENGTLRDITIALQRHADAVKAAGPGTVSLVYYSGHGAAKPGTEINYLIPIDVVKPDDDLWAGSIPLRDIVTRLESTAPAAAHFVIFDACRNELKLPGDKVLGDGAKGFVAERFPGHMVIAYATAAGKTATDKGDGAGIYARTLAEEIVKEGVEAVNVLLAVARRVNAATGQQPWLALSTPPQVYFGGRAKHADAAPRPTALILGPLLGQEFYDQAEALKGPRNLAKKRALYDAAAKAGHPLAQARLAIMLALGVGGPKSSNLAQAHARTSEPILRRAAEAGHVASMAYLGVFAANGLGAPQDYAKAQEWFQKAAALGDAASMRNVGIFHLFGRGMPKDAVKALAWFEKAAALGDTEAMLYLGQMYVDGEGVAKDYASARELFEKAAALGEPAGLGSIGGLYDNGQGVPIDHARARSYYEKAAELGDIESMTQLGFMYTNGQHVQKDCRTALVWYRMAVAAGRAELQQTVTAIESKCQ